MATMHLPTHVHKSPALRDSVRNFEMALSILEMGPVLFGSTEGLITYLQGKGLLATNKQCTNCASINNVEVILWTSTGIMESKSVIK